MHIGIWVSSFKVNAKWTIHKCKFGWAKIKKKMKLAYMYIWRKKVLASFKNQTKLNSEASLNFSHISDSGFYSIAFFNNCGAGTQLYPTTSHPIIDICLAKLFCMSFLCEVNNTNYSPFSTMSTNMLHSC